MKAGAHNLYNNTADSKLMTRVMLFESETQSVVFVRACVLTIPPETGP